MRQRRAFAAALLVLLLLLSSCAVSTSREGSAQSAQPAPETSQPKSSSETSEPEAAQVLSNHEEEYGDGFVPVDPARIVYADELLPAPHEGYDTPRDRGRLEQSDEIVGSVFYPDDWLRCYAVYLPRFGDEIALDGAQAIRAYYEEQAAQAREERDRYLQSQFQEGEYVAKSAMEAYHYWFQDYRVYFAGPYLSVVRDLATYGGGAHSGYGCRTENFDMRTGELLPLPDVMRGDEEGRALLEALLERYADPEDQFFSFATPITDSTNYYFSADGLVFVYVPYENGSFGAGVREISVPWAELSGLLLIDPPEAA